MASFAPEVFFRIGDFPVTNTIINTIFVDGFLLLLAVLTRSKLALIPGTFQHLMEILVGGFQDFIQGIAEDKTKAILPVFLTFFLFILVANLSGLIPGIGTIGIKEHTVVNGKSVVNIVPFNRPATSDLNTTLALAITSLVITNGYAIHKLGFIGYISKFLAFIPFLISLLKGKPHVKVNFHQPLEVFIAVLTPIVMIFVGLLELVSEFIKAISLSFRLFGNIYAGEVVLSTAQGIFAFIFPIPFLLLESIAGVIQALVFAMLTMVFMVILSTHHAGEHEEVSH
jgi:F-type H+-transporting ATPase subunit a